MENTLELITIHDIRNFNSRYKIAKADLAREWMEKTTFKYAYRCLPLNIANQHGWAIYPRHDVIMRCERDDRVNKEDVKIISDIGKIAVSHFGHGTVTFHIPILARTPKGYNLYISGYPNHSVTGIEPLTGIYETDWAPMSFTMNWKFNRLKYNVHFRATDPICFIFPIQRGYLDDFDVKLYDGLHNYPDEEFIKDYREWNKGRAEFDPREKKRGSDWQKHYFQGKYFDGRKCPYDHMTKLELKDVK